MNVAEAIGYRWSRIKCRLFDRHDRYCRGRIDHTLDQCERTRTATATVTAEHTVTATATQTVTATATVTALPIAGSTP